MAVCLLRLVSVSAQRTPKSLSWGEEKAKKQLQLEEIELKRCTTPLVRRRGTKAGAVLLSCVVFAAGAMGKVEQEQGGRVLCFRIPMQLFARLVKTISVRAL